MPTPATSIVVKFNLPLSDSVPQTGPGLWRAHPSLTKDDSFCTLLVSNVESLFRQSSSKMTAQYVKLLIFKEVNGSSKRNAVESLLNFTFNHLPSSDLLPQLRIAENQLSSIQQYHTDTLALRASIHWREKGEKFAGYLKRTVQHNARRKNIPCLRHPVTSALCHTKDDMLQAASSFYSSLYTPDPIDSVAIDQLFSLLPPEFCISNASKSSLVRPFTLEDITEAVRRCPNQSSPGSDGLPYTFLAVLFDFPAYRSVFLQVLNNALTIGDISDLRNWRPISLINTDAKVYTRLLNARLLPAVSNLITPYQTGFMRGRFIADNGLLMKLIMDHCSHIKSSAVGQLLDQEKAYNRVHPGYLRQVLVCIGIPTAFVTSICNLFVWNSSSDKCQWLFSSPVSPQRGLRQGNPLFPVLFNLAFEPFLRSVLQDPLLQGVSLQIVSSPPNILSSVSSSVKLMAYADDVICLLQDPSDLSRPLERFDIYSRASNSLLNRSKTQVISLSVSSFVYADTWRLHLQARDIRSWHDHTSPNSVIYLGFPLYNSVTQRDTFLNQLLTKIFTACNIHVQRSLSVRGHATVVNSLILSTL
ncbi:hypothetical protein G6F56_007662 [Rhizopus delemar]|nr:hypothetical protein G6F56_007662 [Rhizopus delemar]